MRTLAIALLLTSSLHSVAQSSAERFQAAEQQYAAHRADGMTWDDGTPEAAQALDAMWTAVVESTNDFLLRHPASIAQIESSLNNLRPITDGRYNGLNASVIRLDEGLYAVAFNADPAGTVFVLRRGVPGAAWRIDQASAQGKDTGNFLRAWRSSQADEQCERREPNGLFHTCGPINGTVGLLPPSATNAPRFYVEATYSKDAGASMMNQLSVWEWEGSSPALLWIGNYVVHAEATRPVHVGGSTISFGVQDAFKTFSACMSCDGRQLLHRLQLTQVGLRDQGLSVMYPELDRVDQLFLTLAMRQPYKSLASEAVAEKLRGPLRVAAAKAKQNPQDVSVGMLQSWSITRSDDHDVNVCIATDDLGRLNFTYDPAGKGLFKAVTQSKNTEKPCPTRNALRQPYTPPE